MSPNRETLLWSAIQASLAAGDAIMTVYGSDFDFELKGDQSPLTLADKNAHSAITKILNQNDDSLFPILSEEGRDIAFEERKNWETFWMVDPLDGTKEFIKKNGEFTVNIALIQGGKPILGVVYAPARRTLYFAAQGIGAYKRDLNSVSITAWEKLLAGSQKLSLGPPPGDGEILRVIASRSHMSTETKEYTDKLEKKYKVELISAGSSLKFCLIAEGKAHVYPRFAPTMEWDTAAGQAIVEQADGLVLNHASERPLQYNKKNLLNPWFTVMKNFTPDFISKDAT